MNLATRLVRLRRLGLACVGLTVLLMGLGAWVKANGAGLACPDWPACYGEWLPPFPSADNGGTYHGEPVAFTQDLILYEWAHRAVAVVLGLFVIALTVVAVGGRELARPTRQLPAMALCLVIFQGALGAITVRTGNPPWATTSHLVTAVIFLLVLTVGVCFAFLRPLDVDATIEAPKARKIEYVYQDAAPAASDAHE